MTARILLAAALLAVAMAAVAGCSTSWDAEYARGRRDGYVAARDSIQRLPTNGVIELVRSLDAFGLNYTIMVRRGDTLVAQIHGGKR